MTAALPVLVTGASRGIGRAVALELAAQGFVVTVHYHSRSDAAEEVLGEIRAAGGQANLLSFDVADRDQTLRKLSEHMEVHGAFYGVVSNAGIALDNAFPAMSEDEWNGVVHTNLDSFYNVIQPLVMPMIRLRKGGRIVVMTSVSGLVGNRGQVNYSAAKAGLIGASKALSIELAKRKITVNCVAPGVIDTEMINEEYKDEMLKAIPLRRFGQPEEIAKTVGFLFSDGAAYITRQVISVNGGMC